MPENGHIRRPKAVIHGIGTALPEDSKPQNEILELFLASIAKGPDIYRNLISPGSKRL